MLLYALGPSVVFSYTLSTSQTYYRLPGSDRYLCIFRCSRKLVLHPNKQKKSKAAASKHCIDKESGTQRRSIEQAHRCKCKYKHTYTTHLTDTFNTREPITQTQIKQKRLS